MDTGAPDRLAALAAQGLLIRRVPLGSLFADPANSRLHPSENLDAIEGSLRRFGQVDPLVVQRSSGRVIGGNGRLAVMRRLSWSECDVVELDLDDLQATALSIALNRTSDTSSFDEDALAQLLQQLKSAGAHEGIGFSTSEIDTLIAELEAQARGAVEDPGPEEPPLNPVSRTGDLWLLGDHQLLCGDSTKADDVARVMGKDRAALLSTDPPYCVDYTGNDRPIHDGKPSGKDWSHVYREVDIEDLGEFLHGVFCACLPVVHEDAGIYVWHAHVQQPVIAAAFERHDLLLHQVIVWVKPTATFGHGFYRWRHEPCAFGWRRGHKPTHGYGQVETVWELDWEGKARMVGNEHPTQKPTRVFEIPMEQHTRAGEVVFEPFCGSGSQLIAAEKLARRCRAIEISPAFVDVAIRRWEGATGRKAALEATGQTFEEIAGKKGDHVIRRLPEDAFELYFSLGADRSYGAVAEHYRVAKATVSRRAKTERWRERIEVLERKSRERFEKKALDELDATRERHLAGARMLQAKALEALKVLPAERAIRAAAALNIAWKHELLILGEPTERQASVEETLRRQHARWVVPMGTADGWDDEGDGDGRGGARGDAGA